MLSFILALLFLLHSLGRLLSLSLRLLPSSLDIPSAREPPRTSLYAFLHARFETVFSHRRLRHPFTTVCFNCPSIISLSSLKFRAIAALQYQLALASLHHFCRHPS